jgi:hypothetical protein
MRYALALIVACSLGAGMGCGERKAPPAPPPAKPASAWTDANSQDVAKVLMGEATRDPWVAEFRNRVNRLPRVMVGEIVDKSGEQVDVSGFATALAHALSSSLQVGVVSAAADADVVLTGTVNRQADKNAKYFQIDLRLQTPAGDTVWQRGVEREIEPAAK